MRVLITGATGFVGSHLVEHLLATTEWELVGISRSRRHLANVEHLLPRLRLVQADCADPASIESAVAEIRPEAVVHLAGQALEPLSWKEPAQAFMQNVIVQIHLFEAILKADILPVTLIVGSGLAYGLVKEEENPITEEQTPRPASPYAVSKIAADYLGYQYFVSRRLPVLRMRPFNQVGPRQSPDFVVSAFAQQVAEIEAHRREPVIRVGNLTAERDFTDVRDTAAAYKAALEKGEPGEAYNLGSGQARSVQSLLDELLSRSDARIEVETDPTRFRPVDIPRIVCDASKFRRRTGWAPAIPIGKSIQDTLDYWRGQASKMTGA